MTARDDDPTTQLQILNGPVHNGCRNNADIHNANAGRDDTTHKRRVGLARFATVTAHNETVAVGLAGLCPQRLHRE